MPTARALLADATYRLARAGVASPSVDAAALLAHVLETTAGRLLLHDDVGPDAARAFERLLVRRMSRTPLQHITGIAGFHRIELEVGPGVFVPRPETEVLAELAIREVRDRMSVGRRPVVVDLCTGSGALALAIATQCPGVEVHAVEMSPAALEWTHRNARRHADLLASVGSTVVVHEGDAMSADSVLAALIGRVDVVVANPPYIPEDAQPLEPEVALHDPDLALYGGRDGMDIVRGLLPGAAALLVDEGLLGIEHADVQGERADSLGVPGIVRGHGSFHDVVDHVDLAGRPRVTTARRDRR